MKTPLEHEKPDRRRSVLPLVFGLLMATASAVHGTEVARYENERFGFSVRYPSDLAPDAAPANGDGQRFSKGGGCVVLAYGVYNALDQKARSLERERSRDFTTT